jgi:hypothetical protein
MSDGGDATSDFDIGDVVYDGDDEEADPAIVVNKPPKTAAEWEAYEGTSVAEDNPDYPADAPIIVISYRENIAENDPEFAAPKKPLPLSDLAAAGINHYAFPAPRLELAPEDEQIDDHEAVRGNARAAHEEAESADTGEEGERGHPTPSGEASAESAAGGSETPRETLATLEQRLTDEGVRVTDVDEEAGTLTARKLGQSYTVAPGEVLDGEGRHRQRIEQIVEEAAEAGEGEGADAD